MSAAEALLDSNVVVAMISEAHPPHAASAALLGVGTEGRFAVAAHSHAEAFDTPTRHGTAGPYRLPPDIAWRALAQIAAVTVLVGLTPAQTLHAVRSYADAGGIGPASTTT